MTKVENVRFFHCDSPIKGKGCGWTVPADISIKRKLQVCECTACGRITKRNILSNKSVRVKWAEYWQGNTQKAKDVQAKALRVRIEDGYCVEVLNPKAGESKEGKE